MKPARFLRFGARLATHHFTGVDLILTRQCNLSCRYCGVVGKTAKPPMPTANWIKIINYFRRHNFLHFIFTGGEALLYPGLPELVAETSKHSLTCLMTNGVALSADALNAMPDLDFLTLSLDPIVDPDDSHKHAFDKLPLLREQARKTGLSPSIMSTVTRRNIHAIPDIVRMLKPYRFPFLISLYHSGNSSFDFRTQHDDLDFTTEADIAQLEKLADTLVEMRKEGYPVAETDWFLHSMAPFKRGEKLTKCRAGRDWFEVDVDGSIKTCHDGLPSEINALDEPKFSDMKKRLQEYLPENCNCLYDFYYNAQHLRERPVSYLYHVWRTRNLLRR